MTSLPSESSAPVDAEADAPAAGRKRPRPGERRVQILQALATMLEQPGAEHAVDRFVVEIGRLFQLRHQLRDLVFRGPIADRLG